MRLGSHPLRSRHDDTKDRQPMLAYKPESTGTYYIVLHARGLADGKASAGAAMAVTYR